MDMDDEEMTLDALRQKVQEGQAMMNDGDTFGALDVFTEVLDYLPDDEEALMGRCAVLLELDEVQAAIMDAETLIDQHKETRDGWMIKVKCLMRMKKYKEALDSISEIPWPQDDEIDGMKQEVHRLEIESRGIYDFRKIVDEVQKGQLDVDHAEYTGNVRICSCPEGRGLFASEDIQAGSLILASRAFGIAREASDRDEALQKIIMEKLRNRPEIAKELYTLYAGSELGFLDRDSFENRMIDPDRVAGICQHNALANSDDPDVTGVWILPSMINHRCVGMNASWTVLGDFVFITTTKDIKRDDQIYICYTGWESYEKRKEALQSFGFECSCDRCRFEANEDPNTRRTRDVLVSTVQELSKSTLSKRCKDEVFEDRMMQIKSKLEAMCAPMEWGRAAGRVSVPLLAMAEYHKTIEKKYDLAIDTYRELYEITKPCIVPDVACVTYRLEIASLLIETGDKEAALKEMDIIREDMKKVRVDMAYLSMLRELLLMEEKGLIEIMK